MQPTRIFCLLLCLAFITESYAESVTTTQQNPYFIQNNGQLTTTTSGNLADDVLFYSKESPLQIFIRKQGMSFVLKKRIDNEARIESDSLWMEQTTNPALFTVHRIDFNFVDGKNPSGHQSINTLESKSNFFYSHCPDGVSSPHLTKFRLQDIYPGIDIEYYFNDKGKFKYDLFVHPEARLSDVKIEILGSEEEISNRNGRQLLIQSGLGQIVNNEPISYLESSSETVEIDYQVIDNILSFVGETNQYDEVLVVDPEVLWSTSVGTSGIDEFKYIEKASNGFVIGGTTDGNQFPQNVGLQDSIVGSEDLLLSKWNGINDLSWSTYIGGSNSESLIDLKVSERDHIWFVGRSFNTVNDFPLINPVYIDSSIGNKQVICKLGGTGWLQKSTYWPGDIYFNQPGAFSIKGDSIYIGGALDTSELWGNKVFISDDSIYFGKTLYYSVLDTNLNLTKSVFLGPGHWLVPWAVDDGLVFAGLTNHSYSFPTTYALGSTGCGGVFHCPNTSLMVFGKVHNSDTLVSSTYYGRFFGSYGLGFLNFKITPQAFFVFGGIDAGFQDSTFFTGFEPQVGHPLRDFVFSINEDGLRAFCRGVNHEQTFLTPGSGDVHNTAVTVNDKGEYIVFGATQNVLTHRYPLYTYVEAGPPAPLGGYLTMLDSNWNIVSSGRYFAEIVDLVTFNDTTHFIGSASLLQVDSLNSFANTGSGTSGFIGSMRRTYPNHIYFYYDVGLDWTIPAFVLDSRDTINRCTYPYINNSNQDTIWSNPDTIAGVNFQWQISHDEHIWYDLQGETRSFYVPGQIDSMTFIRLVRTGSMTDTSNILVIGVEPVSANIYFDREICAGDSLLIETKVSVPWTYAEDIWVHDGTIAQIYTNTDTGFINTHFSQAGKYPIQIYVNTVQYQCAFRFWDTVIVNPKPNLNYTTGDLCKNLPTYLSSTSEVPFFEDSIISNQWFYGNNQYSSDTLFFNPDTSSTVYVSQLSMTSAGCIDSAYYAINIGDQPEFTILEPDTSISCPEYHTHWGTNVTGNGPLSSWSWDFDDSTIDSISNPVHQFLINDTFEITVIGVNTSGCIDTVSTNWIVHPKPSAWFNIDGSLCEGNTLTFTDSSSINDMAQLQYNWLIDSTISIQDSSSFNHSFNSSGIYDVLLTATSDSGCSDEALRTLIIGENPIASYNASSGCVNDTIAFINQSGTFLDSIIIFQWSFENGVQSSEENPRVAHENAGWNDVDLIILTNNGCSDTLTDSVFIAPLPIPDFQAQEACFGEATSFTNLSTSDNPNGYLWSFGDGNLSSAIHPSLTYSLIDTYYVTLTSTNSFGCVDSIAKQVWINPNPMAHFGFANPCEDLPTYFFDSSHVGQGTITDWYWNFNAGGITSIAQNPINTFNNEGVYFIELTVQSGKGCESSTGIAIDIFDQPIAQFSQAVFCIDNTIVLNAIELEGDYISYYWDLGDGNVFPFSNKSKISHVYSQKGSYDLQLIVNSGEECSDTSNSTATISQGPIAYAGEELTLDINAENRLNGVDQSNSVGEVDFLWRPSNGLNDTTISSPIIDPEHAASWYALLLIDDEGCVDSDTVIIHKSIRINNVITPNGDGANDTWTITIEDPERMGPIEFRIWNLYGKQVYHHRKGTYNNDWSATDNMNRTLPDGDYQFVIEFPSGNPIAGLIKVIR